MPSIMTHEVANRAGFKAQLVESLPNMNKPLNLIPSIWWCSPTSLAPRRHMQDIQKFKVTLDSIVRV